MARAEITGKKPAVTDGRARRKRGPPRANPDNIIQHDAPSTTTRAEAQPIRGPPVPPACYSLATFAAAHLISEAFLHKLRAQGLGPREMKVGRRTLISFEAAAAWRAERERAAATAAE
jgi:hypothetical protein